MGNVIVTVLAFAGAFLGVYAANAVLLDLFPRERKRLSQRLDEEFRRRQREHARHSPLFKDLSELAAEAVADREDPANFRKRFKLWIEQAGLDITLRRLVLTAGASGLALGALSFLLTGHWLAGVALIPAGAGLPLLYVEKKRQQRMEQLRAQLADAFDLMGRVIRAGQTTTQAMQAVADEFSRPIAEEFNYCYEQQNLGLPPEVALPDLARRSGLLEMKIFVLAVMVHRQTGGNFAELLDKLAHVVRDRFRVRGMIRVLTAEGRFQATILLALPPVVFLAMLLLNRPYAVHLFDYPLLLAGTLVVMTLGWLWCRKIVNFDF